MKRLMILAGAVLTCLQVCTAGEMHMFTDTQGRTIMGELQAYDAKAEIATIKAENGQRAKVPLVMLSEADQKYIRTWDLFKDFMDERRFRISVKRKKFDNDDESYRDMNSKREVDNAGYEIRLENKSDIDFNKLTIEYCIFYQQEVARQGNRCDQGVCCGQLTVDAVPARSDKEVLTKAVLIYKDELDADWFYGSGADNVQRGEVHGIWMRVSMTLPDGEKVTRSFALPDSLPNSQKWTTDSVAVGMNK